MTVDKVVNLADARSEEERRGTLNSIDAQLAKSDRGLVLGTVSNLILIIAQDPILSGLLGYNEFTHATVIHSPPPIPLEGTQPAPGPYPRVWDEVDTAYIQSYIQRVWTRNANRETTETAMGAVASMRRFHPVRDWLTTLKWDSKPRIDMWLVQAFAVEDNVYTQAVARVRQPGCKFDYMPIFEGLQGIGKSTLIRRLFGFPWVTDSVPAKLESADAAHCLQGVWCIEFAEIEQIIRTEVEVIKAFLSRDTDRFRAPYGRKFLTYPRQCVLIGTTNDSDYLRDASGNRRFWPIKCESADPVWVELNREQLWAEAAYREAQGEETWLNDAAAAELAEREQNDRLQDDPWEDRVLHYLSSRQQTVMSSLLEDCLQIPTHQQSRREQLRVSGLLKRLGWERSVARTEGNGNKPQRVWRKLMSNPGNTGYGKLAG